MKNTYPVSRGKFDKHTLDTNIHLSASERNILQPGMDMPDFTNLLTLSYSKTDNIASKIYKINAPGYFFYGGAGRTDNSPAGIFVAKDSWDLSVANDDDHASYVLCYHECCSEGLDKHTHLIPIYPGTSTYFAISASSNTMNNYNFMFIPAVGVVSYLKSIEKLPSDAIYNTNYTLDKRIGSSLDTICTMIDGNLDNTAVQRIKDIFSGDWRDNF